MKLFVLACMSALVIAGCASTVTRQDLAVEYYNLGNAYLEISNFEKAVEYFNRAIERDPDLLTAHYNLSLALIHRGQSDRANIMLNGLLAEDPENVAVLKILAYSHYKNGELNDALNLYDKILSLTPVNSEILYNRGIVLWKLDRHGEAEAVFVDLLNVMTSEEGKTYQDTLYNLADLLLEQQRFQESSVYWNRFLERVSDDVQGYLALGRCYRELERYDKALKTYDALLEIDETLSEAWASKAEILLTKIQDPLAGLEALNQALLLGFQDSERIQNLVDDPDLFAKKDVLELLERWMVLPQS